MSYRHFGLHIPLFGVVILFCFLNSQAVAGFQPEQKLNLMPWPKEIILGDGSRQFNHEVMIYLDTGGDHRVETALEHLFARTLLAYRVVSDKAGQSIDMTVRCGKKSPRYPKIYDEESYSLKIDRDAVHLEASTSIGCIRGLTTLGQLLVGKAGNYSLPFIQIKDQPRFTWRGLLIDVVRHWIPKDVILRNLDAMAEVKMNVLHLHLSDDQGFRVESKKFPRLHEVASEGNYYTQKDITEIVEHAASLGIRVVPEFDIPGHTTALLVAYPELASGAAPEEIEREWGTFKPVMDPTNPETYAFLDDLIGEMTSLFPDDFFHIGGDEVLADQWMQTPEISLFMAANDIKTTKGVQTYFNKKIFGILDTYKRTAIGWNEVLSPDLPKQVVVQLWEGEAAVNNGLRSGNPLIRSHGYYLDHLLSAGAHYSIDPVYGQKDFAPAPSSKWGKWDLDIIQKGQKYTVQMLLYENEDSYHGYIEMGSVKIRFRNAHIKNNILEIRDVAEIPLRLQFFLNIDNDNLTGKVRTRGFEAEVTGRLVADSKNNKSFSLEGDELLPEAGPPNMLGLEACMWTEWVSAKTLDSRLWPRLAAIAEKAWSPREATQDTADMYRRLNFIDQRLVGLGIQHHSYPLELLSKLAGSADIISLEKFVSALETVKYYTSLKKMRPTNMMTPLEMIADAAVPDGRVARSFNRSVDSYLTDPSPELFAAIRSQLQKWQQSYSKLQQLFEASAELREVRDLALILSDVSSITLAALDELHKVNRGDSHEYCNLETRQLMVKAMTPVAAVQIASVPAMEKLVSRICSSAR